MKLILIAGLALALVQCKTGEAPPAPSIQIETSTIDAALSKMVETQQVMGVSALVFSENQEIYYGDFGLADRENGKDWQRDTLAAIFSMTKPVTGVTLMSLYEEGLFDLNAPLSDYLPEFTDMKVAETLDPDGTPIAVDAKSPIRVIDIFRHTSCFGYDWGGTPAADILREADILNPAKPLSQFSQELAKLPLFCQPGTQWRYGVSVDVQARLAEVLTGRPYEELVKERVLDPLGLGDTSYFVPVRKKARLAAIYGPCENGGLARQPDNMNYSFAKRKPAQTNGGHGLISSIDDYMRFALMLQNGGTLDGVQIIKPETVALMTKDHLPDDLKSRDFLPSKGQVGFGLDFAVRTAPPKDENESFGVVGEYFWDGAASTLFWVDPKNDITAVFFVQVQPYNDNIHKSFRRAVYGSIGVK